MHPIDKRGTPSDNVSRVQGSHERPKTNQEHHERMKRFFKKPKSGMILDKLVEYKKLSKQELCELVGMSIRSKGFAESPAEMRAKGYVKTDTNSKKFYLSEKCFLKGRGNEESSSIDERKLAKDIAAGRAIIESRKKSGSAMSTGKMIKKEEVFVESIKAKKEIVVKQEPIE